jgi:hypothetical protein
VDAYAAGQDRVAANLYAKSPRIADTVQGEAGNTKHRLIECLRSPDVCELGAGVCR